MTIAQLTRVRGNRGELAALSLSSHPERFRELGRVTLFGAEGFPDSPRAFRIEDAWEHGSRWIFKFEGVDSISDAEQLRGADVCIPLRERRTLPDGEYYHSDLVGCEVVDATTGRVVGRVERWNDAGGNGILQVAKADGGELLLPFRNQICVEIDVERKRIGVELPAGLLELND